MIKNKFFLTLILFALTAITAKAVPAYPYKKTYIQPDGTKLTLTLRGDENFSFYTTDDGQPYVRQPNGLFVKTDAKAIENIWSTRLQERNRQRVKAHQMYKGPQKATTTGKRRGLVLLVNFKDEKFKIDNPKATYQKFFSQRGYNDYGMTGSVSDYFYDQSYGQFDIDFDIIGPLELDKEMSYYGAPSGDRNDSKPADMIYEACVKANDQVNFADYDWLGQGRLESVFVLYAGYGQNYGADPNTIWPHEWKISHGKGQALQLDGIIIDTYACSCELAGTPDFTAAYGLQLDGIGAACHEFSHCLGIPDFYDTNNAGGIYGTGRWDVMCSGSYNNNSRTPAGYTSYERMFAGWLTPTELNTMTRIEGMKALASDPEAYILYNDANKNEYYLLENRQPTKWDAALPGHGMLVLHVDYDQEAWKNNDVNASSSRQRMVIIPADGRLIDSSTSAFPGPKGITELTNYTSPAATLYNNNTDGTKFMSKPIDNIKEVNGLISFVACRPEMQIPQINPKNVTTTGNSFTVKWNAVPDATKYELELTEIPSGSHDPNESRMLEEDFSKCYSKSTGYSDISSNISKYVSNSGWSGSKLYTSPKLLLMGTSSVNGSIITPTFNTPSSTEITVVVGVELYDASKPLTGILRLITNGERPEQNVEFTKSGRQVFHFSTRESLFRVSFNPNSRVYLNYFAIYAGNFTEEELGVTASAKAFGPRRVEVTTFTTTNTSYTFSNLNVTSKYGYRIRALSDETRSLWSEEQEFIFPATGIQQVENSTIKIQSDIFDLNGRRMGNSIEGLAPGIYIRGGKKVVVH